MMRPLVALAALAATSSTALASMEAVAGHWLRSDGLARVRIAPCGSSVCATNTWVKNPKGTEKVGDRLVMTVERKAPNVLKGTAYDPQRKLTYAIEIKHAPESMTTRGCVLGGLLCKAVGWARLD